MLKMYNKKRFIDKTTYISNNHRDRKGEEIEFLILHYTATQLYSTLAIFTNNENLAQLDSEYLNYKHTDIKEMCSREVSAHYVVGEETGDIYQLVDENQAAYHAGISFWGGKVNLNNASIGIEHVNLGYDESPDGNPKLFPYWRGARVEGSDVTWCKFSEPQILATIDLCKKILADNKEIKPYNVLAHSDIAPNRKTDPGPLFPWKRLAKAGVGLWYNTCESDLDSMPCNYIYWMQQKLAEFGYDCKQTGIDDDQTKTAMKAFQMHFREDNDAIDGAIELKWLQRIDSLCARKLILKLKEFLNETYLMHNNMPKAKL